MTQIFTNFNDAVIAIVGRNEYMIHFVGIVKSENVIRVKNADLSEKNRQL